MRQPGGIHYVRYRAEEGSGKKTRSRRASKIEPEAVSVSIPSEWRKRSNEESVGFRKSLKNAAGDGTRTRDVQLGKPCVF